MNTSTATPQAVRTPNPRAVRRGPRDHCDDYDDVARANGYDESSIDAESVVGGIALFGLSCFAGPLFTGCLAVGVVA